MKVLQSNQSYAYRQALSVVSKINPIASIARCTLVLPLSDPI
ncbi:hypothetical protein [uncultured Paraglaciecola sp.]